MGYSYCHTCRHYHMTPGVCPPLYVCWDQDDPDDTLDIREYGGPIVAAQQFAEDMDSHCAMEYTQATRPVVVVVRDALGKITKWTVHPEAVIQYRAYEVEDENSDVDSDIQSSDSSESTHQEPEL